MRIFLKYWLPACICMGIIFIASSIPGSQIPSAFPYQDIVFHAGAYLLLAFFFARALRTTWAGLKDYQVLGITILYGVLYALSDEWHQSFVPYRMATAFDVFVDTAGTCAGSLIHGLIIKPFSK
ncbi:MAG: VanZ family protein [Candidatus Omnitrophica bacterium]|nr:VanZ family protein [Candidatus Omnitrophota bacterium]